MTLLNLLGVMALIALFLSSPGGVSEAELEDRREVASRLLAAGAVDEAAELYGSYLEAAEPDSEVRARIAYSLGATYLEAGRYEQGLRWFYEAEISGGGELAEELNRKIVHALERMGRTHAAEAALASRVRLDDPGIPASHSDDDPVLARIGAETFHRSELQRALDAMPTEVAQSIDNPQARATFLQQFVAQELLWRKARKQEIDREPEVRQIQESLLKQVVVSRFLEREVSSRISVSRTDLESYFAAHRDRYQGEEGQPGPELDEVLPVVQRDLLQQESQEVYQALVTEEMAAAEVELFPERWTDGAG